MGLSTLFGRTRGFFIPYRYAASARPEPYPALEPAFLGAEGFFRDVLAAADGYRPDILRILRGDGPARFDQDWFPRLDAVAAYAMVRRHRPARIVEIGSGHSTRFLARAVADGGLATAIAAIDPAPRASLASLADQGVRHEPSLLRDADPALFAALAPGDVLFVDSSHVAMPGTDVDRIAGDILPRLPAGVLVHVHDILLPDAYPPEWAWRGYNEATVLAALIGSGGWDILFSSHWVASRRADWLAGGICAELPLPPGARETSLWLRKR
ncbi:class I SAM-dependent methyltransferase [Enterovirga sp. DB1703]|uniref:Class I SAM-dependent methyltransferase n=1 Tax=Enterovirga aerilata TaxID=2730920 RepID=A0A849I531_9HYPH|nr:class I SAM-dependent methyltransferase [Enterovirga sp. DB1703]NNM71220.1 class I SAM-dependent methyltransferase [Enterovirga sp. DB1703]